jgi:hypothetical protein
MNVPPELIDQWERTWLQNNDFPHFIEFAIPLAADYGYEQGKQYNDWITDRRPNEEDADGNGDVLVDFPLTGERIHRYWFHESAAALDARWKHTIYWKPKVPTPKEQVLHDLSLMATTITGDRVSEREILERIRKYVAGEGE